MNGGDLIGDVLLRQGVRSLFTLCGGHISPILVACKKRGIRVIDTRHEATAVFAADASARLSGVPGVAAVTAGPGATNTITALKNAQLAESPLVLLGGATATILKGRGSLQDIDQRALLRPHVKRFIAARRVRELVPALEQAFHEARSGVPGPTFVECPVDLLYDAETVRPWYGAKDAGEARSLSEKALHWYLRRHLDDLFAGASDSRAKDVAPVAAPAPDLADVERAAALLRRAQRPVVLVGSQAMLSPAEVPELVAAIEAIGAPVYLSGMARGLLGRSHALQVRQRRKEALREADVVVLAGTPCDFRLDYGRQFGRRTRLVSANRSPRQLRKNRRPDVAVPGAPELFLRALAGAAAGSAKHFSAWLDALRARDAERDHEIEAQGALAAGGGVHPIALLRCLERVLPDDSVIVADGGDFVATASYVLRPRRPLSWLDPGVFGTLGVGGGFALGARLQRPDAELFVLYGDGSLGYSLIELDTFARHGLGVVAIVGNDASWAQIAREQVLVLKDDVGTVLAATDYHRAAEGLGAKGYLLERMEDADAVLAAARADARAGRPALINARLARSEFRKGSISM
jgi:acetolactate synthase-1/2/3 large subunit